MSEPASAKTVFADALELPAAEREAFVRRACGQNAALVAEVMDLIRNHAGAAGFLEARRSTADAELEGPGTVIGRYRLLGRIGEGGFGAVYLAEQREPVVRHVALKIIKPGMDTAQVIARFEGERQALAMMDHPNIAKVLDAGATQRGRPYFVMEYVQGEPITAFCDRHRLTVRERLGLFGQVCNAVQHAHTKGVAHRDIKPSNVLVSEVDGAEGAGGAGGTGGGGARVRVIDFGIAKATDQRRAERTAFTQSGQFLGTPAYMSPEQAAGEADIDTRTDVYSLGVLLYELLTGTTPLEAERLRSAAYGEVARMIREVDPPAPSTRLTQTASALDEVAARRGTEARRLPTVIRGELDWIVMRALEKDRNRRYGTVSALLTDVSRYLAGQTVLAAPPSRAYVLKKFVRRHRVGVAAGAVVAGALVLGIAGTTAGMLWAQRERGRAVQAAGREATQRGIAEAAAVEAEKQKAAAEAAAQAERARAEELRQVAEFQAAMLADVDPTAAGKGLTKDVAARLERALEKAGLSEAERAEQMRTFAALWGQVNATDAARSLIDRTILGPAAGAIDERFTGQPLVAAQLQQVLADIYRDLGLYDAATPLQQRALETRRERLGADDPQTLESIQASASLLRMQGKLADAEAPAREALEGFTRALGADHPDRLKALVNYAFLLKERGKLAEAEPYYREGLAAYQRVRGEEHPDTLTALNNLAVLLQARGNMTEAEQHLRRLLEVRRRTLGEDSPDTLQSLNNLGFLLQQQGRLEEAEPLRREVMEKCRRVLGEEHPNTLKTINTMGLLYNAQKKYDLAEPLWLEVLEKRQRTLGPDHPDTLTSLSNMGELRQRQGRVQEAEAYRREALARARRVLGDDHPTTMTAIGNLGILLLDLDRLAEAEPLYREVLERRRRTLGPEHPDSLISLNNMGFLLVKDGRCAEAEPLLREALEARRRLLGEQHLLTLMTLSTYGRALIGQSRFAEAEMALKTAALRAEETLPAEHGGRVALTRAMAQLYEAWDKAEPGKGHADPAVEWKGKAEFLSPETRGIRTQP